MKQMNRCKRTFELRDDVGQVVLQLAVGGQLKAHVVLCDPGKGFCWINPSLVQDAVDPERCRPQTKASFILWNDYKDTTLHN